MTTQLTVKQMQTSLKALQLLIEHRYRLVTILNISLCIKRFVCFTAADLFSLLMFM